MKKTVPFRVTVQNPPAGVPMKMQKGKAELLEPEVKGDGLVFDFELTVDLASGSPNFLGPFAQGPKDARFVYVNSGTYAGQHSPWGRRAKLSLMSITTGMIKAVLAAGEGRIETAINGTGSDGGPVCASVKNLEWKVAE